MSDSTRLVGASPADMTWTDKHPELSLGEFKVQMPYSLITVRLWGYDVEAPFIGVMDSVTYVCDLLVTAGVKRTLVHELAHHFTYDELGDQRVVQTLNDHEVVNQHIANFAIWWAACSPEILKALDELIDLAKEVDKVRELMKREEDRDAQVKLAPGASNISVDDQRVLGDRFLRTVHNVPFGYAFAASNLHSLNPSLSLIADEVFSSMAGLDRRKYTFNPEEVKIFCRKCAESREFHFMDFQLDLCVQAVQLKWEAPPASTGV